jgi:hypothetical protein
MLNSMKELFKVLGFIISGVAAYFLIYTILVFVCMQYCRCATCFDGAEYFMLERCAEVPATYGWAFVITLFVMIMLYFKDKK